MNKTRMTSGDRMYVFNARRLPTQLAKLAVLWTTVFGFHGCAKKDVTASSQRLKRVARSIADCGGRAHWEEGELYVDLSETDVGNQELAILQGVAELKTLLLDGTRVTDDGLRFLNNCDSLYGLRMRGLQIDGRGLAFLPKDAKLKMLFLDDTNVTDLALSHLAHHQCIDTLDLSRTNVTDAGLVNLTSLKRLRHLYLEGTDVSDEGMRCLKKIKSLTAVNVVDTQVTELGITELTEAMPNVRVVTQYPCADMERERRRLPIICENGVTFTD